MSSLIISDLDPAVEARLRARAVALGRTAEAEARVLLATALEAAAGVSGADLYARIRARFTPLGGADDIEIPPREPVRCPPDFG